MVEKVTLNGNVYSDGVDDEGTGVRHLGAGGHRTNFLLMLQDFVGDAAKNLSTSSATSVNLSTLVIDGSVVLTVDEDVPFAVGGFVTVADQAAPGDNWFFGQVTDYDAGALALTLTPLVKSGTATISAWDVSGSGARGAPGAMASLQADATPQLGGNLDGQDYEAHSLVLHDVVVYDARLRFQNIGSTGDDQDLDLSAYQSFRVKPSADLALNILNAPAHDEAQAWLVWVEDGGSHVITWDASIVWDEGVAPQLATTHLTGVVLYTHDGSAQAFTADAGTDVITAAGHGLSDAQIVRLTTTDTLPAGLSTGTDYYVRDATADTLQLSAIAGGAAIDITDAGTGTHFIGEARIYGHVAFHEAAVTS